MASEKKTIKSSIVEAIHIVIHHPQFLVPDIALLQDNSAHPFEFYNSSLYPFQLGFLPQVPSSVLYLPQELNEMMTIEEISHRKLTYSVFLEFI